ncbi:MAG: DUF1385 domain-containing protein [Clostridiales Family XIII bacterium]|jgi:uncharacterized protein YqhQ|nr:DUF1385 domain-containing protein [Clostridiales Family XIII bacterium]
MDFSKIFIKDASPTKIGGQAVIDGIMMKGEKQMSIAVRMPDNRIHIKVETLKDRGKIVTIPIIRGIYIFGSSLATGMRSLLYSAEVAEAYEEEHAEEALSDSTGTPAEVEASQNDHTIEDSAPEKKLSTGLNIALVMTVIFSIAFSVGIFILVPTALTGLLGGIIHNDIGLNLIEGFARILLFVIYVLVISQMNDIKTVFRYHGAEHECIHCFESGQELTPENMKKFYTLHPRCGTSFLMFVMIISLLLFSLLGWPSLLMRLGSRLILIPVIAGISYEVLRLAGCSDNWFIKILSVPGLALQSITTKKPNDDEREVAIAALKAVL